jgi:hypothetical protein
MRKFNALLFTMLFVIATVCCPSRAASQAGTSSEKPQPKQLSVLGIHRGVAFHTTRYRGLYVGQSVDSATMGSSGCKSYDANLEAALQNIRTGRSMTECLLSFGDLTRIDKIVLFIRTSYLKEYNELVGRYGASLPGRYVEISQDSPDCCNLWRTKDGTEIWERHNVLRKRGSAENAYQEAVVPYTIVIFESQ